VGNGYSESTSLSSDGRFVVFSSNATNLIPGVSGLQIYVKDLVTGEVRLASSNSSGTAGNSTSWNPQITPDGRFVVFTSNATNLIPGVSGTQIYVKDLLTGEVRLASSNSSGTAGNSSSHSPQITPDGRFVVFDSNATNLIPGVSGTHIYVKDLLTGEVRLASSNSSGTAGNGFSYSPQITPDGRFVVFQSSSTNLIPGVSGYQIYVKDLLTGEVRLASSNSSGNAGNSFSSSPQITPDGRFVVFWSSSTNLIPGVSGTQIYVKDLLTGEVRLASSNSSGNAGNGPSTGPQITPDGRFVVFWSDATNLVSGASGTKLYVKDLSSGQVRLVQGVPDGVISTGLPEISSDGRSIAVSFGGKSYILFNPFLVETELEVSQIVGLGAETAGQARNGLETITYFDKLLNELTSIAGSIEARLQVAASNIQTLIDNLEASSSRLSDADIAEEVSDLVAANTRQELSSYLLGVWKTIETTMAETFTNSILSTLPKDTLKDQPQKNTFTKSIYPEFYYTAKETTTTKQAKNTLYLGGVVPKGYFQL